MLIRMLTSLCGPEYSLAPGDEHEFPADEAGRLIEAGFAEPTEAVPAAPKKPAKKG